MRLFFIFILTVITFQSCSTSSDDSPDTTNQGGNNMSMTNNGGTGDDNGDTGNGNETSGVAYQGDFVSGAHETLGKATVNSEKTILNFIGFKTSNGPILDVYLATDTSADTYIDLGVLKGIDGDYQYDLPSDVDFSTYKYVIIWCVDFHVNFGYAVLE
jgi:hypothetical protein